MAFGSAISVVPDARRCFDFVEFIEKEYSCHLKFWVTLRQTKEGLLEYTLFCHGSGDVFDVLPAGYGISTGAILQTEGGNIYRAMWSALTKLETLLLKYVGKRYQPHAP